MSRQATPSVKRQSGEEGNSRQQSRNSQDAMQPLDDAREYMMDYAKQQPEMAALICFGVGFILGWKLKPW